MNAFRASGKLTMVGAAAHVYHDTFEQETRVSLLFILPIARQSQLKGERHAVHELPQPAHLRCEGSEQHGLGLSISPASACSAASVHSYVMLAGVMHKDASARAFSASAMRLLTGLAAPRA